MDESLKRRLIGVLVVIVVLFLLSLLLPHPGTVSTDENNKRVTLDLTSTGAEPAPVPASSTPVPPVIAAPPVQDKNNSPDKLASNDGAPPQIEEPPVPATLPAESMTDDDTPPAEAPKPAPVKPVAKPVLPVAPAPKIDTPAAPAATKKTEVAKAESKPALKMDDSLKSKPTTPAPTKPTEKTPPKAETEPAPAPAAKPATPAVATKPAASPGKSRWFVQLGAFNDIGKAHQVLDKLSPKGLKGIISPLDSAKGTLYRARIGPFASRDQAKQAQDQAGKLGFAGGSVIED